MSEKNIDQLRREYVERLTREIHMANYSTVKKLTDNDKLILRTTYPIPKNKLLTEEDYEYLQRLYNLDKSYELADELAYFVFDVEKK